MAATTYGPMPAPGGIGEMAWYTASEWGGYKPSAFGQWWKLGAPASSSPPLKYRSEVKIGSSREAAETACGMTTKWSGWIQPRLGAAAFDTRSWHCLVQLHGPDYDGAWRGAQPTIMIRNGKWRLEHGMQKWPAHDLMPYVDGQTVYATVEAKMSEIESRGLITVTLQPAGGTLQSWSFNHPTWEHQWSVWHSGLYRGSGNTPFDQGGVQPTYEQLVFLKDCRVENDWPLTLS